MDIISKDHFKTIKLINKLTDYQVCYGGSLEDYLLLGVADKPVGDLDVLIYDQNIIGILDGFFELTPSKPSYFNNFMTEKFTKYNTVINNIKIDFLVSDGQMMVNDFIDSIINGVLIRHRNFEYKKQILKEWVELSVPNDMWAHDKFSKILDKYENFNN